MPIKFESNFAIFRFAVKLFAAEVIQFRI